MKKIIFSAVAVILTAVILAFCLNGCNDNGGEISYTGDYSQASSDPVQVSSDPSASAPDYEPSIILTTAEGETVPAVLTTESQPSDSSTDASGAVVTTVPVTPSDIATTYVNPGTTVDPYSYITTATTVPTAPTTINQYVPTTAGTVTPSTTQSTTASTTSAPTKRYVNVSANVSQSSNGTITVYASGDFYSSVTSKTGSASIKSGSNQYSVSYSVGSSLNSDGDVAIKLSGVPADLGSFESITITIPKDAIKTTDTSGNTKCNNAFSTVLYL